MADHINQGACPDALTGPDSRDPDCPACRAMGAVGEPAMPVPMMIDFAHGASGFRGKMPAYTTDQVRAYGQAMAEHARRVALAEAAEHWIAAHGYDQYGVAASIRAAAQQKGET